MPPSLSRRSVLQGIAGGVLGLTARTERASATIGLVHQEPWRGQWTANWSHFKIFSLNGEQHLLSFRASTGEAAIGRFLPDGQGTEVLWRGQWTPDWTDFILIEWDSTYRYLLSYTRGIGTAAMDFVDVVWQGTTELWRNRWAGEWTHFVLFEHQGFRQLLSYRSGDGTVAKDRFFITEF